MSDHDYDVFLSYSTSDVEVARALAAQLRKAQLRVFLDEDSIRAGENWRRAVDDAVRSARVAVVLISSATPSSKWLSTEIATAASGAMAGESLLIPVLLGDVGSAHVPEALQSFQGVRVDTPETLEQAADAIARAVMEAGPGLGTGSTRFAVPPLPEGYIETGAAQRILAAIEASRRDGSGPVQVIGPPGAGKTTAVLAACQESLDRYRLISWITAITEHGVIRELGKLAGKLGVPDADASEFDLAAAVVARLADGEAEWLLIFDDAEGGEEWLGRWVPTPSPAGTAVVISRRQMSLRGPVVRLQALDDEAALSIFESRLDVPLDAVGRRSVLRLLAQVGDATPLTLAMLAAYLRLDQGPIEDHVDRLLIELRENASSIGPRALDRVAAGAFRELAQRSPLAERISRVLVSVGESAVPAVLFRESADDPFLASDATDVGHALAEMEARGLIQMTSGAISTHPVLAGVLQFDAERVEPLDFLRRAVARRRNIKRPDDRELALTTDLARHALSESVGTGFPKAIVAAAELCLEVAVVLWDVDDLRGSVALLEETLSASESILEPDHPATLTTRANLAAAWQASGRPEAAAELLERTLVDSERVLGPDHPATLTTRANLAAAWQASGRPEAAAELLERTLVDSERVLGPDHPATLTTRANLAAAWQASGRPEAAAELLERTLVDSERVLGPDHPATLTTRANLAAAWQASGRPEAAAELLERTLVDSERVLGPDHPATLTTRANLAAAWQASGRPEAAAELLERTLVDSERVLGPDHPATLTTRANLAAAWQASGRPEAAAELLERTLVDSERVLGPDHPATLTTRANLAAAWQASGRPEAAAELLERTLVDSERLLGLGHPLTVALKENLEHARGGSG